MKKVAWTATISATALLAIGTASASGAAAPPAAEPGNGYISVGPQRINLPHREDVAAGQLHLPEGSYILNFAATAEYRPVWSLSCRWSDGEGRNGVQLGANGGVAGNPIWTGILSSTNAVTFTQASTISVTCFSTGETASIYYPRITATSVKSLNVQAYP